MLVSGGFDPLHIGHVRLLEGAARYGHVCVALNSDDWLRRKKGYVFQEWYERCVILLNQRQVGWVIPVDDADDTVTSAILELAPHYFANGGDRKRAHPKEAEACRRRGTEQLFGIGGEKLQSSSKLAERLRLR